MNDKIPIENVYYMLCYAWNHVQQLSDARLSHLANIDQIHDLLGYVLSCGVDDLVRRGIDRKYVSHQEDLRGVRGKIDMGQTTTRALQWKSRVSCEFEELSIDIHQNQILRASLKALLVRSKLLHQDVQNQVRIAFRKLEGIATTTIERSSFNRVQIGGNRRLYSFLLGICKLLHEHSLVDSKQGDLQFRDFRRDEAKMWELFEDFVIGFCQVESDFMVNPRGRGIRWSGTRPEKDDEGSSIPRMEADLILESPVRRIILDTKFYRSARTGSGKMHSSNLYQLLAYVRNREETVKRRNEPSPKHEGILLYPQVDEPLHIDTQLEGFRIQARTVDLNQDWRKIRVDLLSVLD